MKGNDIILQMNKLLLTNPQHSFFSVLSQIGYKKPAKCLTLANVLLFLCLFFVGADSIGMEIASFNIRLDQLFWLIFSLFLFLTGQYRLLINPLILSFIVLLIPSVLLAYSPSTSFLYLFFIIFNYLCIVNPIYSYVKFYGKNRLINHIKTLFRSYIVLIFVSSAVKLLFDIEIPFINTYGVLFGIPRIKLFFFEPSYLATFLSFWIAFTGYLFIIKGEKRYGFDFFVSVLATFMTTSSTGMLAVVIICLLLGVGYLASKEVIFKIKLQRSLLLLLGIMIIILAFKLVFPSAFDFFFMRIFSGDLSSATGGRTDRYSETFIVFLDNTIFGIGPGNYGIYLEEGSEYVPSNVTLEMFATIGFLPSILLLSITAFPFLESFSISKNNPNKKNMMACALGLLCFFIVLQANQNFYRLYYWLFIGIAYSIIKDNKEEENTTIYVKTYY